MDKTYTQINAEAVDNWCREGWIWGQPVSHECFEEAKKGNWDVVLSPLRPVPKEWFPELKGARVLGLASGGGQQMPIFAAQGAVCTVLDYSEEQLASERLVAERENYEIEIVHADMTKPLPFADRTFDLIFHPVSNVYIEDVKSVWKECFRVLKPGGILLAGLDNGIQYAFDVEEKKLENILPYNPLKNPKLYQEALEKGWGIQFSHTIEEQIGGQLKVGLQLTDIFEDTCGDGPLNQFHVPCFYVTRAVKPDKTVQAMSGKTSISEIS